MFPLSWPVARFGSSGGNAGPAWREAAASGTCGKGWSNDAGTGKKAGTTQNDSGQALPATETGGENANMGTREAGGFGRVAEDGTRDMEAQRGRGVLKRLAGKAGF